MLHPRSCSSSCYPRRLALKLQKDYNLPEKRRSDELPEKLPKLPKRKLLGKDRFFRQTRRTDEQREAEEQTALNGTAGEFDEGDEDDVGDETNRAGAERPNTPP